MKNDALNALIVDLVIENRGLKNQIKTWESLGVTQEMRIYELEGELRALRNSDPDTLIQTEDGLYPLPPQYGPDDIVAEIAKRNEEVK